MKRCILPIGHSLNHIYIKTDSWLGSCNRAKRCENCDKPITGRWFRYKTLSKEFVFCGTQCRKDGTRGL